MHPSTSTTAGIDSRQQQQQQYNACTQYRLTGGSMFCVALHMVRSIMWTFIVSSSSSSSSTRSKTTVLVFTYLWPRCAKPTIGCRQLALGLGFFPPLTKTLLNPCRSCFATLRHCARKLKKLHLNKRQTSCPLFRCLTPRAGSLSLSLCFRLAVGVFVFLTLVVVPVDCHPQT